MFYCPSQNLFARQPFQAADYVPLGFWDRLLVESPAYLAISDSTAERYTLSDPDVRLMLRVRDDDAHAFEELMLRYQDRLVGVLGHLIGKRDLAEDLAQDVFMRVYRARKNYKPGAKFSTWLFTIANNVALNARRSLSRRKEVQIASTEPGRTNENPIVSMAVAASGMMPTRLLDKSEMQDVVKAAIQTLSERQRMALLLSKFEHLSYIEIAEIMQLTPQAVKSLLSRARTNLRDALAPYFEES